MGRECLMENLTAKVWDYDVGRLSVCRPLAVGDGRELARCPVPSVVRAGDAKQRSRVYLII